MDSVWLVKAEDLREYSAAVLQALNVTQGAAEVISGALLDAELRGLDTHGAVRLPPYATLIKRGTIDPPIHRLSDDLGVSRLKRSGYA